MRHVPTVRTTLAAAALGAIALSAPASGFGAIAAVQDDRLAATPADQITARLDLTQRTGARVTRIDLFWNEIALTEPANPTDPNDPAYDWRASDLKIIGMLDRGIRPIVSTYSTPLWSSGGRSVDGTQYNPFAPRPGDYGKFMEAVAKRYSGTFVTGGRVIPQVRHFEVWNEPNLKGFFRTAAGTTSLPAYLALVREAYPAIKRGNPAAKVIAGVGAPRSSDGDGNLGARRWLTGIARSSVKFDDYSQHMYPFAPPKSPSEAFPGWNSIDDILTVLDERRARLKKRGVITKPARLFITEAGYTTKFTTFRPKAAVTEAKQAQYLRQIFKLPQVNSPRVPVIMWFNLQDNIDWPGGLMREDLALKPSYSAFTALTGVGTPAPDLR
jgi:Glycosyl hydrolases family 39